MIRRAEVCCGFGEPWGSAPAKRYPAVVVHSDQYNESRTGTIVVLPITPGTVLTRQPGNVFLPAAASGPPKDSP